MSGDRDTKALEYLLTWLAEPDGDHYVERFRILKGQHEIFLRDKLFDDSVRGTGKTFADALRAAFVKLKRYNAKVSAGKNFSVRDDEMWDAVEALIRKTPKKE